MPENVEQFLKTDNEMRVLWMNANATEEHTCIVILFWSWTVFIWIILFHISGLSHQHEELECRSTMWEGGEVLSQIGIGCTNELPQK